MTKKGKAKPIAVSMYADEWQELIKLLNATMNVLDTEGSEYASFKGMVGHIVNQTSVRNPEADRDG
jgi:hypothetical protein